MKMKIAFLPTVAFLVGMMAVTTLANPLRPEHTEYSTLSQEFYEASLIEVFGEEFAQNYLRTQATMREIRALFPRIDDSRTRDGNIIYPEVLAGYYIDESGNLVVLLTNSANDTILVKLSQFDGVTIRVVEFTKDELASVVDYLRGMVLQYYPDLDRGSNPNTPLMNVHGYGIDIASNRVIVDLYDYNLEIIEHFRRTILDSPMLAFRQANIDLNPIQEFIPSLPPTTPIMPSNLNSLITIPTSDTPSSWAVEQVNAAIAASLVPPNLMWNFTQPITRAEFCALAVTLYEAVSGEIAGRIGFADTNDVNIEKAAYIGVVSGLGDNLFDPNGALTREQAAVMLARLADSLGIPLQGEYLTFVDASEISTWAVQSIAGLATAGIMSGVGNGMFAPNDSYTREQSIVTIMGLFEFVQNFAR